MVNNDFRLWRYPTDDTVANSSRLRLEKIDGAPVDYTQYSYSVVGTDWMAFTEILPAGTYRLGYADAIRSDLQWYVEQHPTGSGKVLQRGDKTHYIEYMQVSENTKQKVDNSSTYNNGYVAYKPTMFEPYTSFDGWYSAQSVITEAAPQWWSIQFKLEPKTINGYEFVNRPNTESITMDSPKTWTLQGRNLDTEEWTNIHYVYNDTRNLEREVRTFYLDEEVTFSQFRMLITATNRPAGDYVCICSFRLFYQL